MQSCLWQDDDCIGDDYADDDWESSYGSSEGLDARLGH